MRLASGEPTVWADYAPDLAVEILLPRDSAPAMADKVIDYLAAGARLVWVVDPEGRRVTVYQSMANPRGGRTGSLTGTDDVLPGIRIDLRALFED